MPDITQQAAAHWDAAYEGRAEEALTWFQARPEPSLGLIARHAGPGAAVLDVGGGAARLADALLEAGQADVTVLDLSQVALAAARARLGARADAARWIRADVTRWAPPREYDLWHDRAVFHFLTEQADRAAYVATLLRALSPGGVAIIATFAPDGPEACSGLPVQRYSPETLTATLEALAPGAFARIGAEAHVHETPSGRRQSFQFSLFRRAGPA
ncbi:class I SAM-dependent methyltransferase [Actibacterium sp. MT2.3-13A]|uniref:class I SAM-dependent methyltransferase n=1 Tax=Actibacterium sp. MT2.3-13A TaxID=2828332 RepID=UPI001BA7418F|nr:class I SAM-dependent methyltransferase [Actibacterium sp. MT2.3-13A]